MEGGHETLNPSGPATAAPVDGNHSTIGQWLRCVRETQEPWIAVMSQPTTFWQHYELDVVWYRFDGRRYAAPVDEYGDSVGRGSLELIQWAYPVLRRTPKGVWLNVHGDPRFAYAECRKRFACPTIDEALESFIARKTRQAAIYRSRAQDADDFIFLARAKIGKGQQT